MPAAYEGDDPLVEELRALRADVAASCAAGADRSDAIAAALDGPLEVTATDALPTTCSNCAPEPAPTPAAGAQTVELGPDTLEAQAAAADGQVVALGVVAGLLLVALMVPAVRRVWLP